MSDEKLSPRHAEFVRQYFLCHRNASEAYRKVYPKCTTPEVNASRLLAKANISAAIKTQEDGLIKDFKISQEQIIRGLKSIAEFNPWDIVELDEKGRIIYKKDFVKEAMSGANFTIYPEYQTKEDVKDGVIRAKLSFQTGDRKGAFELLGKHIGMWKDGKQPGSDLGDRQTILNRLRDRMRKNKA